MISAFYPVNGVSISIVFVISGLRITCFVFHLDYAHPWCVICLLKLRHKRTKRKKHPFLFGTVYQKMPLQPNSFIGQL